MRDDRRVSESGCGREGSTHVLVVASNGYTPDGYPQLGLGAWQGDRAGAKSFSPFSSKDRAGAQPPQPSTAVRRVRTSATKHTVGLLMSVVLVQQALPNPPVRLANCQFQLSSADLIFHNGLCYY